MGFVGRCSTHGPVLVCLCICQFVSVVTTQCMPGVLCGLFVCVCWPLWIAPEHASPRLSVLPHNEMHLGAAVRQWPHLLCGA